MKKHLKWLIPVISVVLIAVIGTGGYFIWRNTRVPTEIKYYSTSSLIDQSDLRQVVGVKNYVFVGYVKEIHDYMTEKNSREFPQVIVDCDEPMTECVVEVIKNIKGNLTEGTTFSFYKGGGVVDSREYIELYENDLMPEVGKYYVFSGYAHEDGTVTGGGVNGTIELEEGITADNLAQSENYKKYVDAVANEILPYIPDIVPRYLATIDRNYGDASYNAQVYQEELKKQAEADKRYQEQLVEFEKERAEKTK